MTDKRYSIKHKSEDIMDINIITDWTIQEIKESLIEGSVIKELK